MKSGPFQQKARKDRHGYVFASQASSLGWDVTIWGSFCICSSTASDTTSYCSCLYRRQYHMAVGKEFRSI